MWRLLSGLGVFVHSVRVDPLDHVKYDSRRFPEAPKPVGTPINSGVPHSPRYDHYSLSKPCFSFAYSSVPFTNLNIGVSLTDTLLISTLLPDTSLLHVTM